jgi:threonine dehydratase/serine racemase
VSTYAAGRDDFLGAAKRIAPWARETPVLRSSWMDAAAGREVHFKCELFQRTGSFKFRGATNAVMNLPEDRAQRGVVTHSSGNHAQALALAARLRGIPAHVVMPEDSAKSKIAAVKGYGGRVILCRPTLAERERVATEVLAETGGALIPPYDHPDVIAGQGTIALELAKQVSRFDAIIAPVGGGGMLSGIALAAREFVPNARVIGAEPESVGDAAKSKLVGARQGATGAVTLADGLRTSLGELTWPVVRDIVDSIATVTELQIREAMRMIYERMKLVIEPSAAVGVAALLGPLRGRGDFGSCCVVLCGGNVDLDALSAMLGHSSPSREESAGARTA